MTNEQCQAYAVIAIRNLIKAGIIKGKVQDICTEVDCELYCLFDVMTAEEAEAKAAKILQNN